MHLMKYCFIFIVLEFPSLVKGQQYLNLTGSTEFALLGKAFNWTCTIQKPPEISSNYVLIKRNNVLCVGIGIVNGGCQINSDNTNYTYHCLSENVYTLIIPADSMTEYEQNSEWYCSFIANVSYRSPSRMLEIAIDVNTISIIPNDNPFTMRESSQQIFECVVNSNAVPAPTITWILGSTNITSITGTRNTSITIPGNRTDNTKLLQCKASNNNKPPKTASTVLNVEYPPSVINLTKEEYIVEGINLSVICHFTPGNPSSTNVFWTKVGNQEFHRNGSVLQLPHIHRNSAGTYNCTAKNIYHDSENGIHSQSMVIKVLYPPEVMVKYPQKDAEEGENVSANCSFTPGYPNLTTVFWTQVNNSVFRQDGPTLRFNNIKRSKSGTYKCTAENRYPNGKNGTDSQSMVINVQYPPLVHPLSQRDPLEGGNISVECQAEPGNPQTMAFFWIKVNNSSFLQNGKTLRLPNIGRNSSGIYKCTAENTYTNGHKGNHSQTLVMNVLYHPSIEIKPLRNVNENESVTLTRVINSNPLSNVTWYSKGEVLKTLTLENVASYTIKRAKCSDTQNFTIMASNGVEKNVTALVELRVNCKPKPAYNSIMLGVTDNTGIEFSTTVVAYPKPQYNLEHINGSVSNQMMGSIIRNGVNNFTITFNQTNVDQSDYGIYYLTVSNVFGNATVVVNILPQRRPDIPINMTVVCEVENAKVQWISSFDGGKPQTFIVFAINSRKETRNSEPIPDKGENVIHTSYVNNLQPSELYVFNVYAENEHGNISSEEMTCTTLKKDEVTSLPLIVGVAAAGGIAFGIIVIVIVLFLRRYMNIDKQARKANRLTQESESEVDDGLKDNILYVSAGPMLDEKPEAAVSAAVNKRVPESNNNADVYAKVDKSGQIIAQEAALYSDVKAKKGLLKKDGSRTKEETSKQKKGLFKKDEKAKHKKAKRPKNRPGETDVYENSEDIALSTNVDNVYSNSRQKGLNEKEERGYKNKDGLLYVEVNFDGKQGQDNPVIHGEDEKTDYATVEFPMPSPLQKASCSEEL